MKFGVYLPNMMHLAAVTQPWEHSVDAAGIVRVARLADELGYAMLPVPEHFVIPAAHVEFSGDHYFDATTAQAFLAGATSRITLGSVATILPLHHPAITPRDHLFQRPEIVHRIVQRSHKKAAVERRIGFPLLKNHRHAVGLFAAEMRNVESVDAPGERFQRKRFLEPA